MDKPFFVDEKEIQALKEAQNNALKPEEKEAEVVESALEENVETSPVLEEEKENIKVEEAPVTEETKVEEPVVEETPVKEEFEPTPEPKPEEPKNEIVKSKLEKPVVEEKKDKKDFVMDLKLFTTIFFCIIVAYLFLSVARNLYFGFKYYDLAHGDKTVEVQK